MTNEERVEMLGEISENTQKCYDKGIEDGKKTEYDTFWDNLQNYGERTDYRYGISGTGWNDTIFKPKYLIQPKQSTSSIFESALIKNSAYTDLLDFSKSTSTQSLFNKCYELEKLKIIDLRNSTVGAQAFRNCYKLKSIEELYFPITGSVNEMFYQCYELTSIGIMSEICVDGLDFKDCTKLDRETLISIVRYLSTTTSGLSITLSQTAVNNALSEAEWNGLTGDRPNWTINLI